ncbi:hypothetical protein AB0L85_12780 [Streptomyces sp. NPDC052051]|uniref:hypothetical protein n=1 Tax=Streptomyces sp. NPDC052051 TaxID=3154649 RepID=UPI003447A6CB
MTQSGQGEEPSAQPAREGIALPSDGHAAQSGGQTWGGAWGPQQPAQSPPTQTWGLDTGQTWDAPEAQQSWGTSDPHASWGGAQAGQTQGGHAQPLPPQTPPGAGPGPMPPEAAPPAAYGQHASQGGHAMPHTADDEGATQYIPPVAADEGATQYIPPVAPGAMPAESLAAHPDEQATQYIAPVTGGPGPDPYGMPSGAPGGDRHPPSEFDNLFRNDAGGADSTQQMPQLDTAAPPSAPPSPPVGRAAGRRASGGRPPSRVPLIAAVGVGIAVVGIGAGALLGAGGGSDSNTDDNKTVAATGPVEEPSESASPSPAADPAREQAVALDKLLADSGNSRGSVVKAVGDVRNCQNLDHAATDLRNAAGQRNELVTRLSGIAVDKLPGNGELTAALTSAWKASAAADNHYAAWANQAKKGCKKGHARHTNQAAAGDRSSGTATAQKAKAAPLWNAIAQKYGLTQRQPTQL